MKLNYVPQGKVWIRFNIHLHCFFCHCLCLPFLFCYLLITYMPTVSEPRHAYHWKSVLLSLITVAVIFYFCCTDFFLICFPLVILKSRSNMGLWEMGRHSVHCVWLKLVLSSKKAKWYLCQALPLSLIKILHFSHKVSTCRKVNVHRKQRSNSQLWLEVRCSLICDYKHKLQLLNNHNINIGNKRAAQVWHGYHPHRIWRSTYGPRPTVLLL